MKSQPNPNTYEPNFGKLCFLARKLYFWPGGGGDKILRIVLIACAGFGSRDEILVDKSQKLVLNVRNAIHFFLVIRNIPSLTSSFRRELMVGGPLKMPILKPPKGFLTSSEAFCF